MPLWGTKPEEDKPERKKSIAPYVRVIQKPQSESRFYLLGRDAEIITPMGIVDAEVGDVLMATEYGLWVLAKEVLSTFGVLVLPKENPK